MPSIEQNLRVWNEVWNWSEAGEQWSRAWGGSKMQWYASILPRIEQFLPCNTILEIAPGCGRWTQFLLKQCNQFYGVDLSAKCIETCKQRFPGKNALFAANSGTSLDMVPDNSIDFVFSFDSLVHVEEDIIKKYVEQIAKKLTPSGVGFIHHSNMNEYYGYFSTCRKLPRIIRSQLLRARVIEHDYWRALSMSAEKCKAFIEGSGMYCISQEIINWGSHRLIDCFTIFSKQCNNQYICRKNSHFMVEAKYVSKISKMIH